MERDQGWSLIDQAIGAAPDDTRRAAALKEILSHRSASEVEAFASYQSQLLQESYTWDLWGAAYVINSGCSDDGFDYFRGWLLLRGRDVWERALRDADSLADVEVPAGGAECEEVLYCAAEAYEGLTGQQLPFATAVSSEQPAGEKWQEKDLPARFPRLWTRFGGAAAPEADSAEATARDLMNLGMRGLGRQDYVSAAAAFNSARQHAPRELTRVLATNNLAWTHLVDESVKDHALALRLAQEAMTRCDRLRQDEIERFGTSIRGTLALALILSGLAGEGTEMLQAVIADDVDAGPSLQATRLCMLAIGLARTSAVDQARQALATARLKDPNCSLIPRAEAEVSQAD